MAAKTTTTSGTAYTGNFIMQVNRPLDNRGQVKTKEDLLLFDNYVYTDMLVMVEADHSLYALVDVSKKNESDYSGWRKISEDSSADIDWLKEKIIENEQVTSQALNLLNALTAEHTSLLAQHTSLLAEHSSLLANQLQEYEQTITTNVQTVTITKATHKCGNHPCVTVYYGNQVAYANVTVSNGDLTITWAATPSVETPILIKLIGK